MGFLMVFARLSCLQKHIVHIQPSNMCADPTMTVPLKHWISHDSWPSWPFGKRPSARLYRVASLDKMKEDWSNAKRHLQWQRETFEKKNAVKQGSRKRSLSATLKSERGGHIIPNKLGKNSGTKPSLAAKILVDINRIYRFSRGHHARPEYGTNGDGNHGFSLLQIPADPLLPHWCSKMPSMQLRGCAPSVPDMRQRRGGEACEHCKRWRT